MKKAMLIILVNFVFTTGFSQNKLPGLWSGSLDAGVKIRLVFHFTIDEAGNYNATMDSPDQNAKGIPVGKVTFANNSVVLHLPLLQASYTGLMESDSVINGVWKQGPASLPLVIKKTEGIKPLTRPQTPKPPFAYNVEEVEYDNDSKSVHLGATLTYPSVGNKFPAVILITGSGQQDRDETIMEHKPFAVIADHLTKMGFAVLRVDDRGMGKSKGELRTATSADFAKDVQTSLQWLKEKPQVDTNRIGLLGHSEGGLIALFVAAEDPSIDFIISMAGPGTSGTQLMGDQNKAFLLSEAVTADAADAYKDLYINVAKAALSATTMEGALQSAKTTFLLWKLNQPTTILSNLNMPKQDDGNKLVEELVKAFRQPWTKYFMESDASILLQKTNAKFLGLFGEKDLQVVPDKNMEGMQSVLKNRKDENYTLKIIPGLNHLFQTCKTCTVAEYGELEETISPIAIMEITNWLQKNVLEKK